MENNKIHILVVDDDDRIRGLLKEYLNENHYSLFLLLKTLKMLK